MNPNWVVELGCGLSLLGRIISQKSNNALIEVDMPNILSTRQKVVSKTCYPDKGVSFVAGDVCSDGVWRQIKRIIGKDPGKVLLLCEGLMRYLSMSKKANLCDNAKDCFNHGFTWVTCDVTLSDMLVNEHNDSDISDLHLAKTVTTDSETNSFDTLEGCVEFFSSRGLRVQSHTANQHLPKLSEKLPYYSLKQLGEASKFVNVLFLSYDPIK